MNRRQLIAGMFSAALLRVSTDLGVARPVIYTPRTIDEILLAEAHRINSEIYLKTLGVSPWVALLPAKPNPNLETTHANRRSPDQS